MRRRNSNVTVLALTVVTATTGCYAHFDVAGTRASYAVSSSDAASQDCAARVIAAEESFNAHGRWWSRSVVAGLVLGAAVSAVAIATGRDTPGDHATTLAEATDAERSFSRLELTTAALAGLAAADALLAWYSTTRMAEDATAVVDQLARCPAHSPSQPKPTE